MSTNAVSQRRGCMLLATLALIAGLTWSCGLISPSSAIPTCQPNSPVACTVIDGYPVGRLSRDCGPDGTGCGDAGLLAQRALDSRDPTHPAPTSVQEFDVDMARVCGPVLCTFSSHHSIVVFTFADGRHAATGYECPGISPCAGTVTWGKFENAIPKPTE